MNIALPESLEPFVHERVEEGGYRSADEYIRELILADQNRLERERVDQLLLQSLDSGPPIMADDGFWAARTARARERRVGDP